MIFSYFFRGMYGSCGSLDKKALKLLAGSSGPMGGMTLQELENTLPNELHDAEVQVITIDYEQRKVNVRPCDLGRQPRRSAGGARSVQTRSGGDFRTPVHGNNTAGSRIPFHDALPNHRWLRHEQPYRPRASEVIAVRFIFSKPWGERIECLHPYRRQKCRYRMDRRRQRIEQANS